MGNACGTHPDDDRYQFNSSINNFRITKKILKIRTFSEDELYTKKNIEPNQKIKDILVDPKLIEKYGGYLMSLQQNNQKFIDRNFDLKQIVSYKINKLYNGKPKLPSTVKCKDLEQNVKQFTYLTAVFCFVIQQRKLIQSIVPIKINEFGFNLVKLYPCGNPTLIVIDDRIPVQDNDPKYSSITTYDPWIYLVEKAWAKTIGSYQNIKGLSPQDAIQQIFGIPSYSYSILQADNQIKRQVIQKRSNFMILTAKSNSKYFYSHQVFYVLKVDLEKFIFHLQCPYKKFNIENEFENDNQQQSPGTVIMKQEQINNQFQYITIGYYKDGYVNTNYPIIYSKQELVYYYKFELNKPQEFSMRIVQFYQKYIDNPDYEYSPVYLKLFNYTTGQLISQGCRRSDGLTKSSNLFENVLDILKQGQYFLAVEIQWLRPDIISIANMVFYSSHEFQITKLGRLQGQNQYKKFINKLFVKPPLDSNFNKLEYCTIQKKKSIFFMIKNLAQYEQNITIKFPNIVNLKPLINNGDFKDKSINLKIPMFQVEFIEFRKIEPDRDASFSGYQIEIHK